MADVVKVLALLVDIGPDPVRVPGGTNEKWTLGKPLHI